MAIKKLITSTRIQYLVGLAVSAVLLLLAFRGVSWGDLTQAFRGVDLGLVLVATTLLVSSLVTRSVRWRVLLAPLARTASLDAFAYMMLGYLVNNVLPLRLGEVIRAVLLGEKLQTSKAGVLATVVVERLLDVLSLLVLVAVMLITLDLPPLVRGSILSVEAMAVVILLVLGWLAWRRQDLGRLIPQAVPEIFRSRVLPLLEGFVAGLQVLRSGWQVLAAIGWSLLSWGLFAVSVALFLHAAGLSELPWHAALLVIVVTNLGSAIPTSPGFVGGYHFLAVFSLSFWSVPRSEALSFAILVHGVNYIVVTLLGLLALWRENIAFGQLQQRVRARSGMVTERSSG